MPNFPIQEYSGLANQWQIGSDLFRADKEFEDRAMKRSLYEAQIANYNQGAKRWEREEAEYEANKKLGSDIAAQYNADPSSYSPSYSQRDVNNYSEQLGGDEYSVPGTRVESVYVPPKKNLYSEAAKIAMASGNFPQAIKLEAEADKQKAEKIKELTTAVDDITKAYEKLPAWGKKLHGIYSERLPELKGTDFRIDEKTGSVSAIEIKTPDGKAVGFIPVVDGKKMPFQKYENKMDVPKTVSYEVGDKHITEIYRPGATTPEKMVAPRYKPDSGAGKEKPLKTPKEAINSIERDSKALAALTASTDIVDPALAGATGNPLLISFAGKSMPPEVKEAEIARLTGQIEDNKEYVPENAKKRADETISFYRKRMSDVKQSQEDAKVGPAINFLKTGNFNVGSSKEKPNRDDVIRRLNSLKEKGWTRQQAQKALKLSGLDNL